ncbi:ferrous iron transport protein B [Treponema sp.]|uniref:ferrous iron transport protein B n=1 Tax=Treponema sp. TaxID=166 RepID=UPI00298EC1CE|nr:ferrous iron transport protein B [Treponema sp.]MCQ2242030.1 ferrous iron transport protein B [Treponema sp.]
MSNKEASKIRIALVGNPNCGKTTFFNALTGQNQYVGNWPGVTVEKKEGCVKGLENVIVTDLPGIYSLSPYTMEEVVARNYLLHDRPEVILNIVDATNLERNLYLTTQLVEVGIPVVIALNMMDVVRHRGDIIKTYELSKKLGCKIVEISALKQTGLMEAAEVAVEVAATGSFIPKHIFSGEVEHTLAHIEEACVHEMEDEKQRWYAIKIFERDQKVIEELNIDPKILCHIEKDIEATETALEDDSESIITNERYNYVCDAINPYYIKKNKSGLTLSDNIDRLVTGRITGLPVFAFVMFIVYYISMVTVGTPATDWVNDNLFGENGIPSFVSHALNAWHVAEWLRALIVDGIIAGVGSVLGFVPQMFVLFLFLSFLEACGYMSRIAFVLDRLFKKIGLSGKSFIPILVGTGCGVPGIMASRTIENESERRMTIITTTFIPCGAKVPFIALIAGSIFGGKAWVSTSAYFVGMFSIILSGLILKRFRMFKGKNSPFVMELPPYHLPPAKNVFRTTWDRCKEFVVKASTIIMVSTIVVWALSNFGFTVVDGRLSFGMVSETNIDCSILARLGHLLSWIFIPLGFGTWQATVASITGLLAKENIVSTLGVLYGQNGNVYSNLGNVFTPVSAYAFLVFNLLCAPCFAAMGAIRREMNSGRWTAFAIIWQCAFAYAAALLVNVLGKYFASKDIGYWSTLIIALLLMLIVAAVLGRFIKRRFGKQAEAGDSCCGTSGCHGCDKCGK